MPARIFLLDGMALAYRAYYAFANRPLINSKGEDTGAVFGFTSTLLKLLREYAPDFLAILFDTSAPVFRHDMYPEYKATRDKMPDEMAAQLPRIRQVGAAMRLPILERAGYEADDLIGALALAAVDRGLEVTIVTGDKDFMQLVRPGIRLLNPRRAGDGYEIVDAAAVREKFGVDPDQVVDVLGLMGDSSDNVPGVPGVGPKTAARLVREHGGLGAALTAAPGMKAGKLRTSLLEYADQARLSRDLVTIDTGCPVALDLETMATGRADGPALAALFHELEFRRLLGQVDLRDGSPHSSPGSASQVQYELVQDLHGVERAAGEMAAAGAFAVDLETTSLDPLSAEVVGISLSCEPGQARYVPVAHTAGDNLDLTAVLERLRPALENERVPKYGQNLKFDTSILQRLGIEPRGFDFDTMVADYLLDPTERPHNLDALARYHLARGTTSIGELIGIGRDQIGFAQVDPQRACDYACEDADITLRLVRVLQPQLAEAQLLELFEGVEMPLVAVLRDMERRGVAIDTAFLGEFSAALARDLEGLEGNIYDLAGQEFNINSTQQVAAILFDRIGLRPRRKTKTGYSTDVSVLEELAQEHPLPDELLTYRELTKLKSTYVDALPALVHPATGRVHASFNQAVTATGRLSASDPNLQNVPIRTPLGREIRKAFVSDRPQTCILSADYSQIELRLLAHMSGDETLGEAFRADQDIHTRTASLVFGLAPEFITPDLRAQAKTVNFGVIYGQSPFGLARQLGMPVARARQFIDSYFSIYSRVKEFIDRTVDQARRDGCVRTMLGRRRILPGIDSPNARQRSFAERAAVNTPIQGSQADMIKVAMVNIHRRLRQRDLDAAMILQVHDELVFEVGLRDLEAVEKLVRTEMAEALSLDVPVVVQTGSGRSWFEAH